MAAPGWYPDPNDPASVRYFDGTAWTDHLQASPTPPPSGQPLQMPSQPASPLPTTAAPVAGDGATPPAGRNRIPTPFIWLGIAIVLLLAVITPWLMGPSTDGFQTVWPLSDPDLRSDSGGILSFWFQFAACVVGASACAAVVLFRNRTAAITSAVICLFVLAITGLNSLDVIVICARIAQLQNETIGLGSVDGVVLPGPGVLLPTIGALLGVVASLAALRHVGAQRPSGTGPGAMPSVAGTSATPPPPTIEQPQPVRTPATAVPPVQAPPVAPAPPSAPSRPSSTPTAGSFGERTPDQYGQW